MTMQTKLTAGYEKLQNAMSTLERPVRIAPAGLAFEHIFKSIPGNASEDGTDFSRLYEEDGTHPSLEGSYLVACVVYATMTGHDPRSLATRVGPPEIALARRQTLQQVAYETVQTFNQQNKWNQQYWEMHVPSTQPENDKQKRAKGNDDSSSSSSHRFSLLVGVVGVGLGVWWYTQQQQRRRQTRQPPFPVGNGYMDASPHDLELTDLPGSHLSQI